jgi:hypothetical protein
MTVDARASGLHGLGVLVLVARTTGLGDSLPAHGVRGGDLRVAPGARRGLRRRILVWVVARFAGLSRVNGDGSGSPLHDLMAALAVTRGERLEPCKKFGRRTGCAG